MVAYKHMPNIPCAPSDCTAILCHTCNMATTLAQTSFLIRASRSLSSERHVVPMYKQILEANTMSLFQELDTLFPGSRSLE